VKIVSVLFAMMLVPSEISAQQLQLELSGDVDTWLGSAKVATGWVNVSQSNAIYSIEAVLQPGGVLGTLLGWWRNGGHWRAEGQLALAGSLQPLMYDMTAGSSHTKLSYSTSGTVTSEMAPQITEPLRLATPDQTRSTVDEVTAYFAFSRLLYYRNSCIGTVHVFDGVKRFDLIFSSIPVRDIIQFSKHDWSGQLISCQISRLDIAGFPTTATPDPDPEPKGQIWFVPADACRLMIPVKISAEIGSHTIYMYAQNVKYCGSFLGL